MKKETLPMMGRDVPVIRGNFMKLKTRTIIKITSFDAHKRTFGFELNGVSSEVPESDAYVLNTEEEVAYLEFLQKLNSR